MSSKVIVEKSAFAESLSIVGRAVASSPHLQILANNPEQEEAEEQVGVSYSGSRVEIGFNVTYLLDALGALPGEDVRITLSDANSSCLIEEGGSGHCKYVVMPMRL